MKTKLILLRKCVPNVKLQSKQLFFSISYEKIKVCSDYILANSSHRPKIGIICGSGLGRVSSRGGMIFCKYFSDPLIEGLASLVTNTTIFPYTEIPGFPRPTDAGNLGRLETYWFLLGELVHRGLIFF